MAVARTSSAPLKMNGNPSTLFTWLGVSERPVATITSGLAALASAYRISGSGLASAKTTGSRFMERTMSGVTRPAADTPTNTSASSMASASVRFFVSRLKAALYAFMPSVRPLYTTPLLSVNRMRSRFTPSRMNMLATAMPDAPEPLNVTAASAGDFPAVSSAFRSAAPAMIAVPCWSSWKTGMFISAFSRSSMTKHSGALMSSRLMPPKVGSSSFTVWMTSSGSRVSISRSKTSMPAKRLNRTALPSMTGFPASAPMAPSPSTAVPLEITATRLPRLVYRNASAGFFSISRQGMATPGVYARDRSAWVSQGLVDTTSSLPGFGSAWYFSASASRDMDGGLLWFVQMDADVDTAHAVSRRFLNRARVLHSHG